MPSKHGASQNDFRIAAQQAVDNKTKPPGSLGYIESVAVQLSVLQQSLEPEIDPARIIVFAADHGVTEEGVSAYPSEVTAQMMMNFNAGGAAVCVFAKSAGADIDVVDVGVAADISALQQIVHEKVASGTANMVKKQAMCEAQANAAMDVGCRAIARASDAGIRCVGLGEMGIGNTTSAAVITAIMTGTEAAIVTGAGTGVHGDALQRKQRVVAACIARSTAFADDPKLVLQQFGGLEIAALVGAMLEARKRCMATIIDGYIVTAAALLAHALNPDVTTSMLFAHRSAEPGHHIALQQLQATPLLDLDMRLGEGSAAALALPLVRSAAAMMCEMATFESAQVSGRS